MMAPRAIWKLRWKLFWDFRGLDALYSLGSFRVKIVPYIHATGSPNRWAYCNFIHPPKGKRIVRLLGTLDELRFEDVYARAMDQAREVLTGEQHLADDFWNKRRNEKWEFEFERMKARATQDQQASHVKTYALNGPNGAHLRCLCGWMAPSSRPHLQTDCPCSGCTQAEAEFQAHLDQKEGAAHA